MKFRNVFCSVVLLGSIMIGGSTVEQKYYMLEPVPITKVRIYDEFWSPRIETNHKVGISHTFKKCEETGSLSNFDKAAGLIQGDHRGTRANDSDVYKIIEGAAYSLQSHSDHKLEAYVDSLIDRIVAAQQDDGYLNTYFTIEEKEKKWENLRQWHELYCAGHFFEAAVAYYQATGKRKILDAAIKFADLIDSIFGPGKRYDVPGHQEIELALIKLYRLTGEKRYLNLSKFFLDERGYAHGTERKSFNSKGAIRNKDWPLNREERIKLRLIRNGRMQDHKPLIEQYEAVGHAVRAGYVYSGMADVTMLTPAPGYVKSLDHLWSDVVKKKLYITGGIGTAQYHDEGFGDPYKLPNEKAYCETCAAVANIFWNHRLNLLHGEAKYIDILELSLYNGFLSSVSLSGDQFFYRNPLASQGKFQRKSWYEPACCPSNVVRFFPQISRYIYAFDSDDIYVNLFVGSTSEVSIKGNMVKLTQITRYPWDGKVKIIIEPDKEQNFGINVRYPGWSRGMPVPSDLYRFADDPDKKKIKVKLAINGQEIENLKMRKGYVRLSRRWRKGDRIEFDLPMPVRRVHAHPNIEANRDRVALMRGPIVYCLEEKDNSHYFRNIDQVHLSNESACTSEYYNDLLGGVVVIKGKALLRHTLQAKSEAIDFMAVPYYSWNNRGLGKMAVWLPHEAE